MNLSSLFWTQNDNSNVNEEKQSSKLESHVAADKTLCENFTPEMMKSKIKSNPLYMDAANQEKIITTKKKPSWTIQDYDQQSPNPKLSPHLKVCCKLIQDMLYFIIFKIDNGKLPCK